MNSIVHFEIPADDIHRAQEFYKSVFGWEINKIPLQEMEYYSVVTTEMGDNHRPKNPGAINGGMMKRSYPRESPCLVINVPSIEEYLQKVVKGGGKIVQPVQKIGDMGLYARFSDSEGNA